MGAFLSTDNIVGKPFPGDLYYIALGIHEEWKGYCCLAAAVGKDFQVYWRRADVASLLAKPEREVFSNDEGYMAGDVLGENPSFEMIPHVRLNPSLRLLSTKDVMATLRTHCEKASTLFEEALNEGRHKLDNYIRDKCQFTLLLKLTSLPRLVTKVEPLPNLKPRQRIYLPRQCKRSSIWLGKYNKEVESTVMEPLSKEPRVEYCPEETRVERSVEEETRVEPLPEEARMERPVMEEETRVERSDEEESRMESSDEEESLMERPVMAEETRVESSDEEESLMESPVEEELVQLSE